MKKILDTQMHLALFCDGKPKGQLIRGDWTRVFLKPCDFILVTQRESISSLTTNAQGNILGSVKRAVGFKEMNS